MAFDFPASPTLNQVFGGYKWDGEKWIAIASTVTINGSAPIVGTTGAVNVNLKDSLDITSPTFGPLLAMSKPAGANSNTIQGKVAATVRWLMELGDSAAESGSNAGTDFSLSRYADGAGALLDKPFAISRKTGQATFSQPVNAPGAGMKNRLINGDFRFDQWNNYGTKTPASGAFVADRWKYNASQANKFSSAVINNSGLALIGGEFQTYLEMTVVSAYTPLTADYFSIYQAIEGLYWYDLGWGLSGAKPVAYSFWVNTTVTGTHSGSIVNDDSSRSYTFTFSVPTPNVWTKITIPIPGDTGSTWQGFTSGAAAILIIALGGGATFQIPAGSWANGGYSSASGSVNVVATASAKFRITGVQIEYGSAATPFDRRPYGTELQMCQRYYQVLGSFIFSGYVAGAGNNYGSWALPVSMCKVPSVVFSGINYNNANTLQTWSVSPSALSVSVLCPAAGPWYCFFVASLNAEL